MKQIIQALILGVCMVPVHAATFTPIDFLPAGISADGSTVVGVGISGDILRWTRAGGTESVGGPVLRVEAVSADGSVIIGSLGPAIEPRAFRWTQATGVIDLGSLPGLSQSEAKGISDDGSIVVGDALLESIRWTESSGMLSLENFPGNTSSSALGISGDGGTIVGTASSDFPEGLTYFQASRWTSINGIEILSDVPFHGFSLARAASYDGSVIVGWGEFSGSSQAFRWSENAGMEILGAGFGTSLGWDVSADGKLIVGALGGGIAETAMVWRRSFGMLPVTQLLTDQGVTNLAGWELLNAIGVSANSQTIVGSGFQGNMFQGWVATIDNAPFVALSPSPTTVIVGGVLALSWSAPIADSCAATGDWSGDRAITGSESVGPLDQTSVFTLTCTNQFGSDFETVTVQVNAIDPPPTIDFYADPNTVGIGEFTILSWSAINATSCIASGDWVGNKAVLDSESVGPLRANSSFTQTCTGPGGQAARTVIVVVQGSDSGGGSAGLAFLALLMGAALRSLGKRRELSQDAI